LEEKNEFKYKAQLTQHRSTDTATLEVGFTKGIGLATEVDLSMDSSQGISQRCKNASALHESMIETALFAVEELLILYQEVKSRSVLRL